MYMYYYDSFKKFKKRIINSNSNDSQREQGIIHLWQY